MGAYGAPSGGAGKSVGMIALVIGVIGVSTCGLGFARYQQSQARRARAISELTDSLARSRSSYNYGTNNYGTNPYGQNSYRPNNVYNPTPSYVPPAAAVPGAPSIISNTGNRSMYEITPVFYSRMDAYRSCVANDPSARGTMAVRFMIASTGRVLTAFASPTSGSATADACVTGLVRSLQFRPSSGYTILIHPLPLR